MTYDELIDTVTATMSNFKDKKDAVFGLFGFNGGHFVTTWAAPDGATEIHEMKEIARLFNKAAEKVMNEVEKLEGPKPNRMVN